MAGKDEGELENLDGESGEKEAAEPQKGKAERDVLREELDKLRSDVDKISQELKSTVDDLKKSIVDIRSAIAEIENPFNILRSISSESDLKKLEGKKLPSGVKSLILEKPEKVVLEEEKREQKPELLEEAKPETSVLAEAEVERPQRQLKPKSAYLDWVWSLLDSGLTADDVLQLAQAGEFTGYLPVHSSEYIYSLASACERVKSKGFKKKQMLISMYRGAVISGITLGSDDLENVLSIAEGRLKGKRAERNR